MKKRVQGSLTIRLSLTPGRCRWCGCTWENGCGVGCRWVDRAETLCSACEDLDRAMRSAAGRHELAAAVQEYDFEALMPAWSPAMKAARRRLLRRPRR